MNDTLCRECLAFHKEMNGGPCSFDIWVVCNHKNEEEKNGAQEKTNG